MQSAGISTSTPHHGCQTVSMERQLQEGQRKFLGTLWNTYAFFVLYANIDEFDATKYTLDYEKLSVMDKWLLSKLNTLIKTVDNNLGNYQYSGSCKSTG